MVVSEINERLSPKKAPPTITAVIIATLTPVSEAIPEAIGTRATMVPTLVPTDIETKQEARNSPESRSFPGSIIRVRLTVASIAPISFAVPANAPARMKIQSIISTFGCPAPFENMAIRLSILPLVIIMAYTEAMRKADATGTL